MYIISISISTVLLLLLLLLFNVFNNNNNNNALLTMKTSIQNQSRLVLS